MKKKIVGILVCMLLIVPVLPTIESDNKTKSAQNPLLMERGENCAGAIATGSVVKDGRSIFWKNRHYSGENNKPFFYYGPVYKFYGIAQSYGSCLMGINEKGLAMGGFSVSGPIDNWEYVSDGTLDTPSEIHNYLLGHFDNVYDAAMYGALHIAGNYQYGIISSEIGVGAILAVSEYDGTPRTNITWINNTYAPLANAFYCDGDHDPDGNDITIDNMLNDIVTNGGINGDFKIDWEEVCQRGGKNVSGKEEGQGTFDCSGEITKANCVSGFVAVSGDSDFDGAANIGWLAMGRQTLVGIWLPLGASCLNETDDIPSEYRYYGGIEDYVDRKVFYGTNGVGQGCNIYYCDRVREILSVTNSNELYMFNEYDEVMEDIPPDATSSEVKSIINSYVEDMVSTILSAYESYNHPPDEPSDPKPEDEETGVPINTCINWTSDDPDGDNVTYDVYFGEFDPYNDPPIVSNNQSSTIYCPEELLEFETKYAWKIVTWEEYGLISSGPIWGFTTEIESNEPPTAPDIDGPSKGSPGEELCWTFLSDDPDGNQVKYIIDWGDGNSSETDFNAPCTPVEVCHTYEEDGEYVITATAEDEKGLVSEESTFTVKVTTPRSRTVYHPLFLWFLERFPMLERLLELINLI